MAKPFKKILIITAIENDRPALDTAHDDMVKCPRGVNAGFSDRGFN